jgi:hypothetical protein
MLSLDNAVVVGQAIGVCRLSSAGSGAATKKGVPEARRAKENSPGREPWVGIANWRAPERGERGTRPQFFRPVPGLARLSRCSQCSRTGLLCDAPPDWVAKESSRAAKNWRSCSTLRLPMSLYLCAPLYLNFVRVAVTPREADPESTRIKRAIPPPKKADAYGSPQGPPVSAIIGFSCVNRRLQVRVLPGEPTINSRRSRYLIDFTTSISGASSGLAPPDCDPGVDSNSSSDEHPKTTRR